MTNGIRQIKPLILGFMLASLLFSCDNSRIYEQWTDLPSSGWNKDSSCVFVMDVTDTISDQNLIIGVRNENSYAYQNIWFFITSEAPQGQSVTDTIQYELAATSGKWHGNGWGSLYTSLHYFKPDIRFAQSGEYKITIRHGMRQENLRGIRSVGFRVEQAN